MPKQLRLGYPGGYYEMSKASIFTSFQKILAPGFGGNQELVLKN